MAMMYVAEDECIHDIRDAIDRIECIVGEMLEFAGTHGDAGPFGREDGAARERLHILDAAMQELSGAVPRLFRDDTSGPFARRFLADLTVARTAVTMVIQQRAINRAMIESLGSLSALQSFLGELAFIDQVLLNSRH
ncbi:MAG: hypothetical protein KDH19_08965 [Geminicoccaceae bacterium]|nr:hypothetical protein [Geminicoccaceae bacterium]MCB2011338.1 hypothetical protein [Geminicoccaceae bacterium]